VTWSFVFLNADVKVVDALAENVRASFECIVRLVQAVGLERCASPKSSISKTASGKCGSGEGRDRLGCLCDGDGPAGGDPARVHQEDPEGPAPRDRVGTAACHSLGKNIPGIATVNLGDADHRTFKRMGVAAGNLRRGNDRIDHKMRHRRMAPRGLRS